MNRFPVGTKYIPRHSRKSTPKVCTVVDFCRVLNLNGVIIKSYYISEYEFLGQIITEYEVLDTTIARGIEYYNEVNKIEKD